MPDLSRFASFARGAVAVTPVTPAPAEGVTERVTENAKPYQLLSVPVTPVTRVTPRTDDAWDEEDWRAAFDERAGILEYEGGYSRATAEAMARHYFEELRATAAHSAPTLATDRVSKQN